MTAARRPRSWRFCVAPMMRYSHRHARQLWRFLCPPAVLYTEMLVADAVVQGDTRRLLSLPAGQDGVALQLGGNCPRRLAAAAALGECFGYGEINLNCGCPSPRVQSGDFGVCLMARPRQVGDMVAQMAAAVRLPITVKCRLGIDDDRDDGRLAEFADTVRAAGAAALIVHARQAWLKGLNPAQNRRRPPLQYGRVRKLKKHLGDFPVVLNGGLDDMAAATQESQGVDGVMLGRAVVRRPYLLAAAGEVFFNRAAPSRRRALAYMLEYAAGQPATEWRRILGAAVQLHHGEANSKHFRRCLSLSPPQAQQQLSAAGYWR